MIKSGLQITLSILLSLLLHQKVFAVDLDLTQNLEPWALQQKLASVDENSTIRFPWRGEIITIVLGQEINKDGAGSRVFFLKSPRDSQMIKILRYDSYGNSIFSLSNEAQALATHRDIGVLTPTVHELSDDGRIMIKDFSPGELGSAWLSRINTMSSKDQIDHILALDEIYETYRKNRIIPQDLKTNNFTFVRDENGNLKVQVFDPGPFQSMNLDLSYSFSKRILFRQFTGLVLWQVVQYFRKLNPELSNESLRGQLARFITTLGGANVETLFRFIYVDTTKENQPLRDFILTETRHFSKLASDDIHPLNSTDITRMSVELRSLILSSKSISEFMQLREHVKKLRLPFLEHAYNHWDVKQHLKRLNPSPRQIRLMGTNESGPMHPWAQRIFVGTWHFKSRTLPMQCLQLFQ